MKSYSVLLIVCMSYALDVFAEPSLEINPAQPTAGNFFQILVSDPAYPNGCAPREVFSLRLRPGNRLELVALPTGDICTAAITPYRLSVFTRLDEPGIYILDYFLGFDEPSAKSISFTVRDGSEPDLSHTEGYRQGFEAGKSACLADPAACGLNTDPVVYQNGRLHIPEVYVIDSSNSVKRYSADFVHVPFSEPFGLEIESAELLDEK